MLGQLLVWLKSPVVVIVIGSAASSVSAVTVNIFGLLTSPTASLPKLALVGANVAAPAEPAVEASIAADRQMPSAALRIIDSFRWTACRSP